MTVYRCLENFLLPCILIIIFGEIGLSSSDQDLDAGGLYKLFQ